MSLVESGFRITVKQHYSALASISLTGYDICKRLPLGAFRPAMETNLYWLVSWLLG